MKKTRIQKAVALLLSAFLLIFAIPAAGATIATPKSLLVLGDSISAGTGLDDTANRYGDLLASSLRLADGKYVNCAVSGATSANLLYTLQSTDLDEGIAAADMIVLSIGGNDMIAAFIEIAKSLNSSVNNLGTALLAYAMATPDALAELFAIARVQNLITGTISVYKTNLTAITRYIETQNPNAKIVLLNQYNPVYNYAPAQKVDTYLNSAIVSLNAETALLAQTEGYEVVDLFTTFAEATTTYVAIEAMDIHPTVTGHAKIAEMVMDTLSQLVATHAVTGTYVKGTEAGDVYNVDLMWGSLYFTYTEPSAGKWDPTVHSYVGVTAGGWSWDVGANIITVANHSNAGVDVSCAYADATSVEFIVTFDKTSFSLDAPAISTDPLNPTPAPTNTFTITGISGDLPNDAVNMQLGTVTVTVAAASIG